MPATATTRQHVDVIDRERRKIEAKGARAARKIGRSIRIAALRAFRRGDPPQNTLDVGLDKLRELLVDGMIIAHLTGRWRAKTMVEEAVERRQEPIRLSSELNGAVSALRRMQNLTAGDVDQIRRLYGSEAANTIDVLRNALWGKVTRTMTEVTTLQMTERDGTAALKRTFDAAGVSPENSFTLENLFRTQTQLAYAAGRQSVMQQPEIDEILWGYEYVTVGDDRVRPNHAAMDGIRLPKDDPFWVTAMPPNGFACRCTVIEVFKGDASARPSRTVRPRTQNIDGARVEPAPDEGFTFNPGVVFSDRLPAPSIQFKPKGDAAKFVASLTTEEAEAIERWTRADDFYSTMRRADLGKLKGEAEAKQLQTLKRAIKRAPKHEGVVYRGVGALPHGLIDQLEVGGRFREFALASTSKNQGRARVYILRNTSFTDSVRDPDRNVLFEIRTQKGRDISAASPVSADAEVVILKSHRFKILSKRRTSATVLGQEIRYTRVVMEEII